MLLIGLSALLFVEPCKSAISLRVERSLLLSVQSFVVLVATLWRKDGVLGRDVPIVGNRL